MASSVQSIYQYWKQFDLPTLQKELDETATELANRQDESENSRKKLVDLSRDFKKNTPEDIRKVVTPLLKSFQGEVDGLCKRSKAAEAAFLTLYKRIVETPDPAAALETATQWQKKSQRVQDLEIENANLKETLNEYNSEFAEVKNQEVTIRQLKEKIKTYEEQLESSVSAKLSEKEGQLARAFDEREKQLIENNNVLQSKANEAEHRANALQASLNAAQQELFMLRSHSDEMGTAKSSEFEMVISDLEKANQRAAAAERECELLKESQSKNKSLVIKEEIDSGSQRNVDSELAAKDRQISQLLEEITQLNAKTAKEHVDSERKLEEMAKQLMQKTQALQISEEKNDARSDYEEVKRELSMLKSIYLGSDETELAQNNVTEEPKSLEVMLLEKNKALQVDKSSLRSKKRELEGRRPSAVSSSSTLTVDCAPPRLPNSSHRSSSSKPHATSTSVPNIDQSTASAVLSSSSSTPPLRSVVERMACLIGTELVNQYQSKIDQRIKNELDDAQAHLSDYEDHSTEQAVVDAVVAAATASMPPKEKAQRKSKKIPTGDEPPLTSIEEAVNSGVPREIIECIAIQHLQQALAANVNKIKLTTPLQTTQIANHCRQVLNTYNIGQRLLAKCVLNQSQGAVSELLAKPKNWDKLTEKGKESFRRLQAWLSDEPSISILRMISPKRAYGGFRERYPPKPEDKETQEKISAILFAAKEAQRRVQRQSLLKIIPLSAESGTEPGNSTMTPSPVGSSMSSNVDGDINCEKNNANKQHKSSGRYRHDDIPKEMIYEIYKRELAKLREQEHCYPDGENDEKPQSPDFVSLFCQPPLKMAKLESSLDISSPTTPAPPPPPPKHRRKATHVVRVSQPTAAPSVATVSNSSFQLKQQLSSAFKSFKKSNKPQVAKSMASILREFNSENSSSAPATATTPKIAMSNSKNGSSSNSSSSAAKVGGATTPLMTPKRTDSANSSLQGGLNSLSPTTPVGGTKLFKAILTPITQEQFEKYGEVNTEELVKEVKDYLSQYSISQRLFGEQVLGLSQGSVSDLLARPKPWNMLTQKGREPFIRMQMFMEDKEALKKLMTRRAREQQNGEENSNQNSNDGTSMSFLCGTPPPLPVERCDSVSSDTESLLTIATKNMKSKEGVLANLATKLQQPNPHHPANTIIPMDQVKTLQRELEEYDIQLDTQSIVHQVKDILLANNIGQKVFGEAVLGMSQGAVSDLLAKSKAWPNLSVKGKEAFVRMNLWLQDEQKIEKVYQFRNNKAAKRAAEQAANAANSISPSVANSTQNHQESPQQQRQVASKANDSSSLFGDLKKPRIVLNDDQKESLRVAYEQEPYPSNQTISDLAKQLHLSVRTVVNWFHNHRMRLKVQAQLLLDRSQSDGTFENDIQNVLAVLQQATEDNDDDGMSNGGESYSKDQSSTMNMHISDDSASDDEEGDEDSDYAEFMRSSLLERLENSVRAQEMSWDTEEDRNMAIARIEQHVHTNNDEDWEF